MIKLNISTENYILFLDGSGQLCRMFINFCRDELKQIVTSDLRNLLGTEGQPTFVK